MQGESDSSLIARALVSGDTCAFGELVRRHQSQLRQFLMRLARDPDRADDLAQDSFVHAWDRLASYRGTGSFAGWILKIAWTTFLQDRRREVRYREVLEQAGAEQADTAARGAEELTDLDRFLAVLPPEDRAVLVLSYAFGLSHREIGEIADLPVGTVKSIIFRGKQKIRESFEIEDHQYGGTYPGQ